jgi:putative ABC transport system permease protein
MYYSYLKLLIRNLLRKSLYQGINIIGLSLGFTVASLVALYAWHELSYDRFHTQHDSIVRISRKSNDTWFASLSAKHSTGLRVNPLPGIEKLVRLRRWPNKYLQHDKDKFFEEKVLITDSQSHFFDMFDFHVLEGNIDVALDEPNSIVLTKSIATKIFGDRHAVGEALIFDTLNLKVTAVISDLPSNTHLDFGVLITNDLGMEKASGHLTYCKLSENADTQKIREALFAMPVESNKFDFLQDCKLIPLNKLHFEGNMTYELKPPGNKSYLVICGLVGLMALVLSCFNFINLSIALYSQRAKEIAVRKIVGARRRTVFIQFLFESISTSLVCLPLVILLIEIFLPKMREFMGVHLENLFTQNIPGFLILLLAIILIGLLSGLYPALILPRINSLLLFKSGVTKSISSFQMRFALVGFQILIMVIAISSSWIIKDQLIFLLSKDLGFNKEGVIKLKGAWGVDSILYNGLKTKFLNHPSVLSVSQGFAPGDEDYGTLFKAADSDIIYNDLIAFNTDSDYLKTLGLEIIVSDFDYQSEIPTKVVLINETLSKRLGYGYSIGQSIVLNPEKQYERSKIINGVIKDFNFFSLHQSVVPMMLTISPNPRISQNILVKINSNNIKSTVDFITATSKEMVAEIPLSVEFLDEALGRQYDNEQKLSFISNLLLVITVVLAAIGLVGLASHTTEHRTKEIGIRKVLGASIGSILTLVSSSYLRVSLFTFVIGSCTSFYLTNQWLDEFAYKISISWTVYLYTWIGLVGILVFTVGLHSYKASITNPVKSLRSE